MKKITHLIFIPLMLLVLFCVSCASAPETPEDQDVDDLLAFVDERLAELDALTAETTGSLDELMELANLARKRAVDFEAPAYFPGDWEETEAKFAAAVETKEPEALVDAADTYDELFRKALPHYAKTWEDEILAARDLLISTGLKEFSDYLRRADLIALTALDQYEAEDYYVAKDTAATALYEYETLYHGAVIYLRRQELKDRGFAEYDPENFAKADEIACSALELYEAGEKKSARELGDEAMVRYNLLMNNSWTTYSSERRTTATEERNAALSHKVNIAARDRFREAETIFNQANENFDAGHHEEAALLFVEAEALYAIAGQETEEKRIRAEEAIKLAEEKIEGSIEAALEAERIIEGGSR